KKLGLFVCCASSGPSAEGYIDSKYPRSLTAHASVKGVFGGEFLFQRMGFFDRMIIKMIAKNRSEGTEEPRIELQSISAFASEWNCQPDKNASKTN
ncbi:MAG: flavodoxin domain-containing protein, partial [Spirochaetaceae bacterium]|nr:flavodoxin domain-containing protein [Spirochaetaceae bacterium]